MSDNETPPVEVELDESMIEAIAERVAARTKAAAPPADPPQEPAEPAWAKTLREQNDDLKSLLSTPKRSELEEGGVKAKPGEPVFYGGEDKYTAVGSTDAERATNLYLVREMCDTVKGYSPSPRLREVMVGAADKALRGAPREIPAHERNPFGGLKAVDPDRFVAITAAEWRAEARTKAMVSTTANQGDEWVPTFASAELWTDVHLATAVTASVTRVNMPTNPYTLPTLDSDVTFYYASTENTAVTGSQPNTGNATLTARKIQADVTFSGEVTEDSIIPIAPAVRANLVRRAAQTMDDLIVHGDTETAASGNVNSDDTAPAAGSFYLSIDGMRKFCLVTNTGSASQITAALSTTNFTTARAILARYGARTNDVRCVMPASLYYSAQDIASVRTVDTYGPNATIVQGELARFFGIPILLSEAIPGATTDKVDDDGKYTTTSVATNDTDGWFVLYNTQGWKTGFRRELQIEADRNIQTDSNILVCSFRMALIPSGISTIHTVVGYDITV